MARTIKSKITSDYQDELRGLQNTVRQVFEPLYYQPEDMDPGMYCGLLAQLSGALAQLRRCRLRIQKYEAMTVSSHSRS